MLVLSRQAGTALHIYGPARIEVVKIQGNRVTLGIKADGRTQILRAEIDGRDPLDPPDGQEAEEGGAAA